ncbi:Interleukin-1 receptor-associated kinase 4 [Papilio machaon]|uniref:Interleukin-1 receptor-associated kinase 4 n=1 Tax=Papilio machaon TaxID=76193 RepID=A0A194RSH1_PAPMA|nr:Interleukin-1 receptor-associated kinase 4 [Papilio machaon]
MELRKLPAGTLYDVINTLETNSDWKNVMSIIPKNLGSSDFERKYSDKDIRLIENYSKISNRQCAEILIDEWGTSGKIRPTLSTLKEIVQKANILKAADQIAALLHENRVPRPPDGPGADIDTDVSIILKNEQLNERFNSFDPTKRIQNDTSKDKNVCNISTVPMKTENGDISYNIPAIDILQTVNFTGNSTQVAQSSRNIPNLELMVPKSEQFSGSGSSSYSGTTTNCESEKQTSQDQQKSENISFQKSLPNISDLHSHIDKEILEDTNLINFEYRELENITSKFSETIVNGPFGPSGKIGSGGFGEVFLGYHPKYRIPLAVKKIHTHLLWPTHKPNMVIDMFNTEVKNLIQFRHKNIVPILGFSMNGPVPCIICEYVDGGSLEEQLARKVLTERQRINIMMGTAEGLKYLHTSEHIIPNNSVKGDSNTQNVVKKNNFVHRDVKSANILLTKDCVPKICDFGLVKQYESTFVTTSPMGTSAYMAPEGFYGTITQKIDIYSYGVVLLELLTGLKPIVSESIKEKGDISSILDPTVENWTKAREIYELSRCCLQQERFNRPSIEEICETLSDMGK